MDSMIMVRTSYCPHSSFGPTSPASTSSESKQAGPGGAHTVFFNCATLSFVVTRDYCNADYEERQCCSALQDAAEFPTQCRDWQMIFSPQ